MNQCQFRTTSQSCGFRIELKSSKNSYAFACDVEEINRNIKKRTDKNDFIWVSCTILFTIGLQSTQSMKKRVLFLTPSFSPHIGGVEKHVYMLSQEFIQRGYEVHVLTVSKSGAREENLNGIHVHRFSCDPINKLQVWKHMFLHLKLFLSSNSIHAHDVYWWYFLLCSYRPYKLFYKLARVSSSGVGAAQNPAQRPSTSSTARNYDVP